MFTEEKPRAEDKKWSWQQFVIFVWLACSREFTCWCLRFLFHNMFTMHGSIGGGVFVGFALLGRFVFQLMLLI